MDDELRAAYGRIDDALTPPGDAVALVAERVAVRRRRRTIATLVASASAVAVIAGTAWAVQGSESATRPGPAEPDWAAPTHVSTPTEPPVATDRHDPTVREDDLTCTGPRQIATVQNPADYSGSEDGPGTVEPWLAQGAGYEFYRVDPDQIVARLIDPEDDVYAELGLVSIDGQWRVEAIAACTSAYPGLDAVIRDASADPAPGLLVAVRRGAALDTLGRSWVPRTGCDLPTDLIGVGQASSSGDELTYVDVSGRELTFVPAGTAGTLSCDPPPPSGPTAQLDVDCDGATWRVGTVVNPETHAAYRDPQQAARAWDTSSQGGELREVDANNVVANLVSPSDRHYASLGLVRVAGYWYVESVSACTTDYPGLEAAEVFGSGLPLVELVALGVGHCWVDTLQYRGTFWDVRDEDQFGWGGGLPEGFLGVGSMEFSNGGNRLIYTDASGARLALVPDDTPGTEANEGGCY